MSRKAGKPYHQYCRFEAAPSYATIFGDGSGGEGPIGWAAIIVLPQKQEVVKIYGGLSFGTLEIAELFPFIQGLFWLRKYYPPQHEPNCDSTECPIVYCVSDSAITVARGQGTRSREADKFWWNLFEQLAEGFDVRWRWSPRKSNEELTRSDQEARNVRLDVTEVAEPPDHQQTRKWHKRSRKNHKKKDS